MTDSAASDAAASDERSRVPPASRTPAGSPKPGPPARGLTTEQVMAAALHLVDTEGLSALSMRRLARAVDREAMTLYRYAASKTSLLDGVTDLVLRGLDVNPRAADWRQELRKLADDFRALALAHPNVVPLLLTRPLATPPGRRLPGTLRPLEDFLELFTGAGFTPPGALHAYRLFFGFLHGHVLHELQELIDNPDETDDLLRLGLHRLPLAQFPRLRALASELAGYDGATQLHQGVEMMITGLESHFKPDNTQTPLPQQ